MTDLVLVDPRASRVARSTIAHHSKSFALASLMLGAKLRDHTAVIYTWCRRVDDSIDMLAPASEPMAILGALRAELDTVYSGTASDPVLVAFSEVVRARQIPRSYPEALLAGMEMDARGTRYSTLDDLLLYCWRVASAVGLMMSHVFGVKDDRALVHAAHLGIAMQLTNVCRDVTEDWERGRLYLPDAMLAKHGVAGLGERLGTPFPRSEVPALAQVVRELLERAERYYRSGDRGLPALPWRAAFSVRAARNLYSAIGEQIAAKTYDVTAGRAVVPRGRKLTLFAHAMGHAVRSLPNRVVDIARRQRPRVPTIEVAYSDVPRL